ncbi:hypothetical protein [Polaribacter sp. Hel_I_88]|uniref:hypothetical protein n=1 Tax=Polaribacter sp. Hel_I_88 TaxID=1250006 RepID=UPI00047A21E3|nr:hypothetical protein [Polaribacter sp. Hel_I_88]|tara:strand:+ start:113 stop:574 length:462 start_codon:yes stop_codon:yes gene_type:complete
MKNAISIIAIIGIGAFIGNMLNIGLSHAVYWQSLDPIAFMDFFAIDFPLLLVPTVVTLMPAWLGTLFVFLKNDKKSEGRKYWRLAFLALTLTIIQTSIYHLPINLDFVAQKYDVTTATNKLNGWVISHWIRIGIAIISGVYAIKGFQQSTINQ